LNKWTESSVRAYTPLELGNLLSQNIVVDMNIGLSSLAALRLEDKNQLQTVVHFRRPHRYAHRLRSKKPASPSAKRTAHEKNHRTATLRRQAKVSLLSRLFHGMLPESPLATPNGSVSLGFDRHVSFTPKRPEFPQ